MENGLEVVMSYEINIIAINQKKEVQLPFTSEIILHNEVTNTEVNRYAEIWPIFSHTTGILYTLVKEVNEGFYSSFSLCDSDFDSLISKNLLPGWILNYNEDILTPLIIRAEVYDDSIKIVEFLLVSSPNRTIMFQSRYQGGDDEIIVGVIKFKKFKSMFDKKEILFNVCYIIEGDF